MLHNATLSCVIATPQPDELLLLAIEHILNRRCFVYQVGFFNVYCNSCRHNLTCNLPFIYFPYTFTCGTPVSDLNANTLSMKRLCTTPFQLYWKSVKQPVLIYNASGIRPVTLLQ